MRGSSRIGAALLVAALMVSAAGAKNLTKTEGGRIVPPSPAVPATPVSTPSTPGSIVLNDDFSNDTWGVANDTNKIIQYVGTTLNFVVHTMNYFVWSTPDQEAYDRIHMETTVINNGTDATTAIGFMCNQQSNTNSFHYLVFTPGGEYAIARAEDGLNDVFLTNNDRWAKSDLIAPNSGSYRLGADCGNGELALYIDGQLVDRATDTAYSGGGGVGVVVWSGEKATTTDVSIDDFEIRNLN